VPTLFISPQDAVAVGVPEGARPDFGTGIWFEAVFARERLWIVMEFGKGEEAKKGLEEAMNSPKNQAFRIPSVGEIRFYRAAK
jgi:hypothetical protein